MLLPLCSPPLQIQLLIHSNPSNIFLDICTIGLVVQDRNLGAGGFEDLFLPPVLSFLALLLAARCGLPFLLLMHYQSCPRLFLIPLEAC